MRRSEHGRWRKGRKGEGKTRFPFLLFSIFLSSLLTFDV
jgi:hypothetical protein